MKTAIIALCLLAAWLPWLVLINILVNRAIADYRARKRQGRAMEAADRDFVRFCYVTLLVALWLGML